MAKKKKEVGNVAFQVRLDATTHGNLKKVADNRGMSLNQLVTGLLRGCDASLVEGEPYRDQNGFVCGRNESKCVFVGKLGSRHSQEEIDSYHDASEDPPPEEKGEVWFSLDYTGRGYVPGR